VQGFVPDGLRAWGERNGAPASSEVHEGDAVPEGTVLDVGDPGVRRVEDATLLSVERMWTEAHRLADREPVVILAGRGVCAAMAIGMLERAGIERIVFWKRS
ncbi:MAG TPA: hypothetical protein VFS18_03830, partial [Actinomycetota bacterium]|nr:hypothetical protein [Actinomycetota bacterium]